MEILLSVGFVDTAQNANLNIVLSLAKALNSLGHTCTLVGFLSVNNQNSDVYDGINFRGIKRNFWIDYFTRKTDDMNLDYEGLIANKTKLLGFAAKHPLCMAFLCLRRLGFVTKAEGKTYKKGIKSIAEQLDTNAVVAFCAPFHIASAAVDKNAKYKQIYYQLDPYGLHTLLDKTHKYDRIEQEISLINKADAVLTTKLLFDDYLQLDEYAPYAKKMHWVDFPVLEQKQIAHSEIAFDFKAEDINMLFCGSVDDNYRNPQFLLYALKPILQKNKHIKVYFLGGCNSKILLNAAQEMPEQIIIKTVVPLEIAQATMQKADVLINIGNNIPNMMPSKIFDYFAKGKPILNVEILEHCPANSYFMKYPLQMTINAISEQNFARINELETFILQSKTKKIEFAKIEELYKTATPKYVAMLIAKMIKEK